MNKELEALNYLYNDLRLMRCLDIVEEAKIKSAYECLQQALQRLEAIDNANPSEALKWLEKYRLTILFNTSIVENALLKAQENEKLLQVIKQEFKLELYAMCKRRLELSTNANRDNLEKILEWLKKEE